MSFFPVNWACLSRVPSRFPVVKGSQKGRLQVLRAKAQRTERALPAPRERALVWQAFFCWECRGFSGPVCFWGTLFWVGFKGTPTGIAFLGSPLLVGLKGKAKGRSQFEGSGGYNLKKATPFGGMCPRTQGAGTVPEGIVHFRGTFNQLEDTK